MDQKKKKEKRKEEGKQHGVMCVVYTCDDKQTFHIHLIIISIKNHKKITHTSLKFNKYYF